MNNYHLFLIRSDQVTQIIAHLTAGIVALVLILTLVAPTGDLTAEPRPDRVTEMAGTIPEGTEMIAAAE